MDNNKVRDGANFTTRPMQNKTGMGHHFSETAKNEADTILRQTVKLKINCSDKNIQNPWVR